MKKGIYILFLLVVAVATTGLYHLLSGARTFEERQPPKAVSKGMSPVANDGMGRIAPVESPAVGFKGEKTSARETARVLIEAGRFGEAADLLRREAALEPRNRALLIDLARVLVWSGRPEEAVLYYRQALGDPI